MERLLIHAAILVLTGAVGGGENTLLNTTDADARESVIDTAENDDVNRKQGLAWLQASPSLSEILRVDHDRRIHDVLVHGIASSLDQMTGLERSHAVCTLATSPRVELRTVAALSLECPQTILGSTWCLEQLAQDPAPIVRVVAARAAKSRRSESPHRFAVLLARLQADPDPAVARAAQEIRATHTT